MHRKIMTAWGNKFLKNIGLHGHISRLVENNQGRHNVVMIEINNTINNLWFLILPFVTMAIQDEMLMSKLAL